MIAAGDDSVSDDEAAGDGALRLPDLRLVLGHVHRQQHELPQRGARSGAARQRHARWPRTPARWRAIRGRRPAHRRPGPALLRGRTTDRVLPRSIATFAAFENAMTLDIAMGGSTNTVLHILAIAHEAGVQFTMKDIDRLSRQRAQHLQGRAVVALSRRGRPPRRRHLHHPRRARPRRASSIARSPTVHAPTMGEAIDANDFAAPLRARRRASAPWPRPAACAPRSAFSQDKYYAEPDDDGDKRLHPRRRARLQQRRRPGRALRQPGRGRLHREDRRGRRNRSGTSRVRRASSTRRRTPATRILGDKIKPGDVVVIRYEGPQGRPGHAGDAVPDVAISSRRIWARCAR